VSADGRTLGLGHVRVRNAACLARSARGEPQQDEDDRHTGGIASPPPSHLIGLLHAQALHSMLRGIRNAGQAPAPQSTIFTRSSWHTKMVATRDSSLDVPLTLRRPALHHDQ
jgi:hypothetical protein